MTGNDRRRDFHAVVASVTSPLVAVVPLVVFLLVSFTLPVAHGVETNSTSSGERNSSIHNFLDRFMAGELTKMDTVILVALGVLGMEAANVMSVCTGGT
jgi:hypothetical protein